MYCHVLFVADYLSSLFVVASDSDHIFLLRILLL